MVTYTITKRNFLSWYYESGLDEDDVLIAELGELVKDMLIEKNEAYVTTEDIFNKSNHAAIRCFYLEEFEFDTDYFDDEIGDMEKRPYEIKLI